MKIAKVLIFLLLLGLTVTYTYETFFKVEKEEESKIEIIVLDDEEEETYTSSQLLNKYQSYIDEWNNNYNVNNDYVGTIYFDSGLINLPFVQGETNNQYLRTDWITEKYTIEGTVLLDSSIDIDNGQNIILYGHNIKYRSNNKFAPLSTLRYQENYENNKIINLMLKDRLEQYLIVSVFWVKTTNVNGNTYIADGEPFYNSPSYTQKQIEKYFSTLKSKEYYDTGETINYEDRFLTLQTCFVENKTDRLIVLSKLVKVIDYDSGIYEIIHDVK